MFWYSMMNLNTAPPAPQPKHLNVCREGLTLNDGLFSRWNGQSAMKFAPARFKRHVAADNFHDVVGGGDLLQGFLWDHGEGRKAEGGSRKAECRRQKSEGGTLEVGRQKNIIAP